MRGLEWILAGGLGITTCVLAGTGCSGTTRRAAPVAEPAKSSSSWYFAVSGDSRDCGDVVMPRIAAAIRRNATNPPVAFYWHLGDFRKMHGVDCDMRRRDDPSVDCARRPAGDVGSPAMGNYLDRAWKDFIERQLGPFGTTPVFLAIGNHQLYSGRTREDVRRTFQRWLTEEPIHSQRHADYPDAGTEGDTYYHFVHRGIDFIILDNASGAFDAAQVAWLRKVLARSAADARVSAIVVGMHATLPGSTNRYHAMDATCDGRRSGNEVYDFLSGAAATKKVFVFSSHSHRFAENVYDQPEHAGHVIPGWVIGTAGASQPLTEGAGTAWPAIRYGYVEVEVSPEGEIVSRFREIRREDPTGGSPDSSALLDFCFAANKSRAAPDKPETDCDQAAR